MKCECGEKLGYAVTPFMTTEKRVCPGCKKAHYIEDKPIDWARVFVQVIYLYLPYRSPFLKR